MSENNGNFGVFLAGLTIGGLIGAAVALILAPQSGEETQRMIKDKSIEIKDRAVEYGADTRLRAEKAFEDARVSADKALEELHTRADEFVETAKERAASVQESLQASMKESSDEVVVEDIPAEDASVE